MDDPSVLPSDMMDVGDPIEAAMASGGSYGSAAGGGPFRGIFDEPDKYVAV